MKMTKSIQKSVIASSLIGGLAFAPFPIRLQPINTKIDTHNKRVGFWGTKLRSMKDEESSSSTNEIFMNEQENSMGGPKNRPKEMQIVTEIDGIPTSSTYMFSSSTSTRTSNIDVSDADVEDDSSSRNLNPLNIGVSPLSITQKEADEQQMPPSSSVTPDMIDVAEPDGEILETEVLTKDQKKEKDLIAEEKKLLEKEQQLRLELENQIKEEQHLIEQQEALRKELILKVEEEKRMKEQQRLKKEEEMRLEELARITEEEKQKKEEERLKKEEELLRIELERIAKEQQKQDEETRLSKEALRATPESDGDSKKKVQDTVAGFSNSMPGAEVVKKYVPPLPKVPQSTGFSSFDIMKSAVDAKKSEDESRLEETSSSSERNDEFTYGTMSQVKQEYKQSSSSSTAGFSGQPPGSGDVKKYSPPSPIDVIKGVVNPMGGGVAGVSSPKTEESSADKADLQTTD
jgi:hypothetical protein